MSLAVGFIWRLVLVIGLPFPSTSSVSYISSLGLVWFLWEFIPKNIGMELEAHNALSEQKVLPNTFFCGPGCHKWGTCVSTWKDQTVSGWTTIGIFFNILIGPFRYWQELRISDKLEQQKRNLEVLFVHKVSPPTCVQVTRTACLWPDWQLYLG